MPRDVRRGKVSKMKPLRWKTFQRAVHDVQTEFSQFGFWHHGVGIWLTNIYLVPLATCEGVHYGYHRSVIHIPAISPSRLFRMFGYQPIGVRDVLRHELMHAVQHHHGDLLQQKEVTSAFGGSVFQTWKSQHNPELHVSRYAATNGYEHFAETGMLFLKHSGRCPLRWQRTQIEDQFEAIRSLGRTIKEIAT